MRWRKFQRNSQRWMVQSDFRKVECTGFRKVAPSYQRVRRSIVVNDVRNIPVEVRETHKGKTAQPGDQFEYEQFLLYETPPHMPPLLVLTATEDFELNNSKHVVCDGNFKFQFTQPPTHTIHGFVAGERHFSSGLRPSTWQDSGTVPCSMSLAHSAPTVPCSMSFVERSFTTSPTWDRYKMAYGTSTIN